MPRRTVWWSEVETVSATISLLLLMLATLARGFPAAHNDGADSSGSLPFLQFTNGGIRVNFGGYHAQAGLGGLLTGSSKDGSLYASAGTPSGAHASAGLGGTLNGGPAGGLHARAGLGNGGPEAEAGLAGSVAGPRPQGSLYADSSAGNSTLFETPKKIKRSKTHGKYVQVIPRPKKDTQQDSSTIAALDKIPNISISTHSGGEEAERIQHPARWYFQKRLHERVGSVTGKSSYNAIASAPDRAEAVPAAATGPAPGPASVSASASAVAAATSAQEVEYRAPVQQPQNQQTVFTKYTPELNISPTVTNHNHKSTLFDDIFNIPISALKAVNQLLKNHVG